jgi:hypothetical protein
MSKQPLCEAIGHSWKPTTSPTVRKCSRSSCRLVQRLHKGRWVNVTAKQRAERPVRRVQDSLWR